MGSSTYVHSDSGDRVAVSLDEHLRGERHEYYVLRVEVGYSHDVHFFFTPEQAEALRAAFGEIARGASAAGHVGAYPASL